MTKAKDKAKGRAKGKDTGQVVLGVITGAVGVKGEVRIKPFTEDPADVARYGPVQLGSDVNPGARSEAKAGAKIKISRLAKGGVVARLEGVTDRNAAEALKGTELFVERAALPEEEEDEFYHADLIGLAVEDLDGQPLGKVKAIFDFGGGDMLEMAVEGGQTVLVPFTRDVVPEVLIAEGRLKADLPEGVMPEEKPAAGEQKPGKGRIDV